MAVTDLDSFIKTIKKLIDYPAIDTLVDQDQGVPTLSSCSASFIQNIDDDELINQLSEVEYSTGYFVFDDHGLARPQVLKALKSSGIELVRLNKVHEPFTHALRTEKFSILVTK